VVGGAISGVYNSGKLNGQGGFMFASLGTTMGFEQYVLGTGVVAQAGKVLLPSSLTTPTFTLSSNGLFSYASGATVAAVPETNTWAMALLGVGFMGFVARRKQA
jgi:hypothetical protein